LDEPLGVRGFQVRIVGVLTRFVEKWGENRSDERAVMPRGRGGREQLPGLCRRIGSFTWTSDFCLLPRRDLPIFHMAKLRGVRGCERD
jgi:hypothetical protein